MMEITGSERLRFGPYEVDLHTRELWKHGTRVKLVGQPFDILAVLVKRSGQLVTRDELRAQLWPEDTFVDFNHGLNAAVNKLRDALCDSADDPKYIETLPRRGYRFLAQVEPVVLQAVSSGSEAATTRIRDVQTVTDVSREPEAQGSPPATKSETRPPDVRTIAAGRKVLWLRRAGWLAGLIAILWLLVNIGIFDHLRAWRSESQEKKRTAENLGAGLARLTDVPDPTSDAAFSPEGNRVVFRREGNSRESSGLFVKAVHDSQLLQLTDHIEDCCPVFSPDGGSIAFSRFEGSKHSIFVIPSGGGAPRKLYTTAASSKRGDLDWSPDGKTLAFVDQTAQGTSSIFILSMDDLSVHRITEPPPLNHDWGPAFSPDGQTIAFIRTHETGLPQNIVIMPAGGGESRVVVSIRNGVLGPPAWTPDGESLVFSSGAEPRLLRVPAFGTGETKKIPGVGVVAWHPAIARSGRRLAFQTSSKAVSVWQSDLQNDGKLESRRLVVTDAGRNEGAQVSPDGSKLVFMSNRSGSMEIWVSDRDGSNPVQLTSVGAAGTPRWSPDGRSVVFDVTLDGRGAIFTVDLSGAPPRMLQQDNANNLVPNWSSDGRWIYFASDRTGMWQVWKIPASGGAAVQVTTSGGFAAYEFNHILYYSRFNMPNPEVWMMPVGGGPESLVSPLLRPETWASWVPAKGGIYFIHAEMNGQPGLMFFDLAQQQVSRVANLASMPFWLAATPDGKTFLYEHLDQENNHIMLLENFQ